MKQLTFTDFLNNKNMEYASKCRHCNGHHCYMENKDIEEIYFCPCGEFEQKLDCAGCKHIKEKPALKHCITQPICKRYCFNPDVRVKDLPDKWEE